MDVNTKSKAINQLKKVAPASPVSDSRSYQRADGNWTLRDDHGRVLALVLNSGVVVAAVDDKEAATPIDFIDYINLADEVLRVGAVKGVKPAMNKPAKKLKEVLLA